MLLKDPRLLSAMMATRDMSGARLGRMTGVSRQFIHQLVSAQRTSCTDEIGQRIEAALQVKPGALFDITSAAEKAREGVAA